MEDFIQKWQNDKKFRAKMKLLLYALFVFIVSIYALSINKGNPSISTNSDDIAEKPIVNDKNIIDIPNMYTYTIKVIIDDTEYIYNGEKQLDQTIINKTVSGITTEYILKDNNYYIKDNGLYIKTTQEEVYGIIKYNYIDLNTINDYLKHSTIDNNQYIVYLKDIILDINSEEYFVILVNGNQINIDYTPLMKQNNPNINSYKVYIQFDEIE